MVLLIPAITCTLFPTFPGYCCPATSSLREMQFVALLDIEEQLNHLYYPTLSKVIGLV